MLFIYTILKVIFFSFPLKLLKFVFETLVIIFIIFFQAPPSMGFSRQEYWSGVPLPWNRPSVPPFLGPLQDTDPSSHFRSYRNFVAHFLCSWYSCQCPLCIKEEMKVRTCACRQVQFSLVAQLCLTLCDPMNPSTPGLPVHHQLPEFTQTHVH